MLCNNHPAISYISWFGLVIIGEDETPYIITNGKSCLKYVYWESDNPYVLRESNEWISESPSRKMIYINDNGTGTEVPHENLTLYYNDTGSGGVSTKLTGEMMGKFDELNGKYMTIQEDVNGIKEVLGSSSGGEGSGTGNSLIERLNVLERTAEGTNEKISTVEKQFNDNKELEELRNNMNISIINLGEALAYYEDSVKEMSKDMEVSSNEKADITVKQNALLDAYTVLSQYHQNLIQRLENSTEDNSSTITKLNNALSYLQTSINNLNSNVNTSISDNTIVPSEVTTMLNMFANVAVRNNEYKNTVSNSILLGVGGKLIESVLEIKKTSSEFNQTISNITEEIDGETGLKVQVTQNATAIKQNADTISLECVKFNETTSQLTVGDGVIKLDAGKVLMTGTLTWDSLDDVAKQNLKGADGTAEYVMLIGDQIFKYDKNGVPNTNSITLTAQVSNIENPIFDWYYRNEDVSTEWTHISNNVNSSTFTLAHDSSIWGNNVNSVTIRVTCNNLSDDMTIIKLYDGAVGQDAKTVTVSGEQLFRYSSDFMGTPSPTSITLNGYKNNITSTASRWYYRVSDTDSWTEITSSKGADILTITHDSSYFGNSRILMIKYEVETYSDIISIAKISDGSDGYFVLLTNENHSVPCDENGNYTADSLSEAYTYVRAYKGLDEITFSLTKTDNGCTSVYNTSTRRLEITSLTNNVATVTMNITIDGNVFQKVMTITKSIKGEKGEDGTGVNILGQLDNISELPSTGTLGDAYIIDGLIYVWSENTNGWSDGVPFRGEQGLPGKDGIDGRTTYLHIKYSNDGTTFTNNNGEEPGDWLGQYTDYIETDSTIFSDYTWKKIRGEDGDYGIVANLTNDNHIVPTNSDGTLGDTSFEGCSSKISLSYVGQEITTGVSYGYTASTGITGTWDSTTGTYTVIGWSGTDETAYVDLRAIYNGVTYTKRFTLSKAKKPLDAYTIILTNEAHTFAGDTLNALAGSTTCGILAYRGTELVPVTIGAVSGMPSGMTVTISNNNTTSATLNISVTTAMVTRHGTLTIPITVGVSSFTKLFTYAISLKGTQGEPGIPGKDGKDGNSVRVLGRYNTVEELNSAHPSDNENGDGYIVNKDLYVWTDTKFVNVGQFQGEDGASAYVHIKYSNDGTSFTGNDGEDIGSWIGMYTDNIQADSTRFSDYKWSKIEGDDAKLLSLSANRQVIAFNSDNTVKDSTAITLTANQQNFSDSVTWNVNPSVTLSGSGNSRILAVSNFTNNDKITITVTSGGLTDTITLIKVIDGTDGESSYNVILSNESHTFIGSTSSAIDGSTICNVMAYKGATQIPATIGAITGIPTGMNVSILNNNSINAGLNISVTTSMTTTNGTLTIPVTIDGNLFTRVFTYSVALKGNDGSDAKLLSLSANKQAVAFNSDNTAKDNTAITLTANQQNFNDALTWSASPNVTLSGSGNNRTLAISNFTNNNQITITVSGGGLSDSVTIVKITDGQRGADGTSVKILDSYDTVEQLNSAHPSGNENGDGYMVGKDLYVWNGTAFINVGQIRGNDGADGKDGTNGSNAYVHIKYSNDGGKTFTSNSGETTGDYMGVYSDNIQADSTNPSDYNWSLTKGNDGWDAYTVVLTNESHTFAGGTTNAIAGSTTCNVIAYKGGTQVSATIGTITGAPTGMSTSISNNNSTSAYFTVTVTTSMNSRNGVLTIPITVDGITFTKRFTYSLSLNGANGSDGTDGADAKLLSLSANRQVIAFNSDNTVKDSTAITLTANQQNFSDTISWSTSPSVTLDGSGKNRTLATSNFNSNNKIVVTISSGELTDSITLVKIIDGADGEDSYSIILTNESHTFAGGTSNAIEGSTTCGVIAYKGDTRVSATIGSITGQPTGMTTSISSNNSVNAYFTVAVTTSMSTRNGVLTIPITVDGISFTKRFTYSLSLNGANGVNGANAKLLSLSANRQAIAFNSNNTAKDSTEITLTAIQQNFSDSISWSTNPSVSLTGTGLTRGLAVSNFNSNSRITITVTAGGISDSVTIVKVVDGANGTDGSDGADAYTINLSNDNHSFIANSSGTIETQQATTTVVTAYKGTTSVTPSFGTLPTVNGLTLSRSGTTITIIATTGSNLATHGSFNIPVIIDGYTFNKAFSYSKVNCGENGEDGYTVILTNEAHIFPCENNGNIATAISTTTQVRAFKGTTEITPTIGTLPSVTGLTLSKSGTTITIQANIGTSLASSGSFNIPITANGVSFTKTFSWSKSFAGADGTFEGEIPEWITEWDNGKTTINGTSVITPRLFAGTVSNSTPTGVAIGKNVFGTSGTYGNVSGIVGYKSGTKTYEFNVDGSILVGSVTGNYLSWSGSSLEIVADNISIGTSVVVSEDVLNEAIDNVVNNSTYLRMDDDGFSIVSQGEVVRIKSEEEIDAVVAEFNNRFETLERGEGFAMVFDQKYAEYGVGGAVSVAKNVRNSIDFQSDGSIRLHGSGSDFALLLEKDQLSFQQNGNAIAWMSTDVLYIKDGEFTNSLRLGNFKWVPRENGNLSFIHI